MACCMLDVESEALDYDTKHTCKDNFKLLIKDHKNAIFKRDLSREIKCCVFCDVTF